MRCHRVVRDKSQTTMSGMIGLHELAVSRSPNGDDDRPPDNSRAAANDTAAHPYAEFHHKSDSDLLIMGCGTEYRPTASPRQARKLPTWYRESIRSYSSSAGWGTLFTWGANGVIPGWPPALLPDPGRLLSIQRGLAAVADVEAAAVGSNPLERQPHHCVQGVVVAGLAAGAVVIGAGAVELGEPGIARDQLRVECRPEGWAAVPIERQVVEL